MRTSSIRRAFALELLLLVSKALHLGLESLGTTKAATNQCLPNKNLFIREPTNDLSRIEEVVGLHGKCWREG